MAKFEFKGISKYIEMLEGLDGSAHELCKVATYAGAKVVADEIKANIRKLRVVSDAEALAAYQKGEPTLISYTQREDLLDSFGIAPIKDKYGVIGTKVGWDDYNSVESERWPVGQPNRLIANACESGSSAMLKQPFVRPAVNKVKDQAVKAMDEAADKEIKKILGG